ncbi:hypothetical protein C8F04DRAFT_1236851 [Mycena alexandri]|uniref:Uncharacterized protein n=1 Tax=Mycena alexandri TaxID=1745969 RepID=A0AAD6SKU0_9AGAR|nr:hypothetical protein C8F04DRAFT_1236851 [Mycena alexandri]
MAIWMMLCTLFTGQGATLSQNHGQRVGMGTGRRVGMGVHARAASAALALRAAGGSSEDSTRGVGEVKDDPGAAGVRRSRRERGVGTAALPRTPCALTAPRAAGGAKGLTRGVGEAEHGAEGAGAQRGGSGGPRRSGERAALSAVWKLLQCGGIGGARCEPRKRRVVFPRTSSKVHTRWMRVREPLYGDGKRRERGAGAAGHAGAAGMFATPRAAGGGARDLPQRSPRAPRRSRNRATAVSSRDKRSLRPSVAAGSQRKARADVAGGHSKCQNKPTELQESGQEGGRVRREHFERDPAAGIDGKEAQTAGKPTGDVAGSKRY